MTNNKRAVGRQRIKQSVRAKISGTPERPRLSVYRSNKHIYAQLIDDVSGHTVAAASSREEAAAEGKPVEISASVGEQIARKAVEAGIKSAVFDRNGYRYHGRVKALAEGARKGGLSF